MQKLTMLTFFSIPIFFSCLSQTIDPIPGWAFSKSNEATVLFTGQSLGKKLFYQVRNTNTSSGEIEDWFNTTIATDIQKEKWIEPVKGSFNKADDILLYITAVTDSASQKWLVCYMGYGFGNNRVRAARVISTTDAAFFQSNGGIAAKHFGSLAREDRKNNPPTDYRDNQVVKEDNTIVKKTQQAPKSVVLNGVKKEQIYNVIMHLEYEAGVGGGIYPVYNPYVLFKDSSIYKEPFVSLDQLDIIASRKSEPLKWGKWKTNGTTIITYWAAEMPKYQNKSWEQKSFYNVMPAKKGEILEGNFKTISGGGNTALGGDVMVVLAANIAFNKDGRFTLAKIAGVTSQRDIWETNSSKSNEAGKYKLDDYSIEFTYNNGKTEKRFFYFYPDSRKHFGIGNSVYMPMSK